MKYGPGLLFIENNNLKNNYTCEVRSIVKFSYFAFFYC